jgi:ABC-type transporter Mla subunit MlaD
MSEGSDSNPNQTDPEQAKGDRQEPASEQAGAPEATAADHAPSEPRLETPPVAASFGASLRRLAQAAGEAADTGLHEASRQAQRAAEAARPEAERLARQAKDAIDAARPHVERAAEQARDYVVEHEEELKRAAQRGARVAADAATPRVLRPAVRAAEQELRQPQPDSPAEGGEAKPEGEDGGATAKDPPETES